MKIKISKHSLCISPYISTSWSSIASIHGVKDSSINKSALTEGGSIPDDTLMLSINLIEGETVDIPHVSVSAANKIMETFQRHLDANEKEDTKNNKTFDAHEATEAFEPANNPFAAICNMLISISQHIIPKKHSPADAISTATMEAITQPFQHNPAQKNSPALPSDLLAKVTDAIRILHIEGRVPQIEDPVRNCNCLHCQVSRQIHDAEATNAANNTEPDLSDDTEGIDVSFSEWKIQKESESLYLVSNSENEAEKYHVYLGKSIGCTCGENNCIHIKTVLRSCDT